MLREECLLQGSMMTEALTYSGSLKRQSSSKAINVTAKLALREFY